MMRMVKGLVYTCCLVVLLSACGTQDRASEEITVLSYNIWHDQMHWPDRLDMMLAEIRRLEPDVICLQEVLQHENLPNQSTTIADSLGMEVHFTSVDGADRPRRYGNAILARSIVGRDVRALEPADDYRNAGYARVAVSGTELDVYCTHLHHTATPEGEQTRRTQIGDLLAFIGETASAPVILAGDFNAEPVYPEMRLLDERFVDTWTAVHGDEERPTTLNQHVGHQERWIDYIFIDRGAAFRVEDTRRVLDDSRADTLWASDHFGVLARIRIDDGGSNRQDQ
jgi:endonuclease/exonuclease/phosphatase family metal-dependent hydrolase